MSTTLNVVARTYAAQRVTLSPCRELLDIVVAPLLPLWALVYPVYRALSAPIRALQLWHPSALAICINFTGSNCIGGHRFFEHFGTKEAVNSAGCHCHSPQNYGGNEPWFVKAERKPIAVNVVVQNCKLRQH